MTSTEYADAIVVGAGCGGLTTAAYLAAMGRQVVVVDRQPMPGGNTAVFRHEGYEFDIGLHYLGGFRDARPGVRAFLEPLGIHLQYRELDPDGFDELLFEDGTFSVPKGVEAFRSRLHEAFPAERDRIDRFLKRLVAVGEEVQQPTPAGARDALAYAWRNRELVAATASRATLGHELDRLDCSPRLRVVLSWLHGVYAVAPSRAAFAMHAGATMHYLAGAWYPEGGAAAVSDALVDVIRRHGGEVLFDTEVTRIITENGAVAGVRLAPGPGGSAPQQEELRAPAVVAAGDLKTTFRDLLEPADVPARVRRRVEGYEMTGALFIVYLVLDRDLRAEGMSNHNWHVIDCDDIDSLYASFRHDQLPAQQWTFITSASLKDPENPRLCRPGQTNLQLITGAPSSHAFWRVGPAFERGAGYAERKRQLRDRAVRHAERAIPGLSDAIVYEESATPITLERYLGSTAGTSYGIAGTPAQMAPLRPGPRTPVDGLYIAGASARAMHGITYTMLGGTEAASAITGVDVLQELGEGGRTAPAPSPVRAAV